MIAEQATLEDLLMRVPRWGRSPIIAGYRGSHAHGTYIEPTERHGTDDVDVFAVVCRDLTYYLGVTGYLRHRDSWNTNGDTLDVEIHEVRKFVHLLEKGNPNVHTYLWLDPADYFKVSRAGRVLIDNRRGFFSRRMFTSFAGYAYAQLKRMQKFEKKGYMGTKREGLLKDYGYDIKNAAHCIRLLHMGVHLARHGELIVRLSGEVFDEVMAVKSGGRSFEFVQRRAEELFREFDGVKDTSPLPDKVDRAFSDRVSRQTIEAHFEELVP